MKILIEKGAKVNFNWEESPIHRAASNGQKKHF